MYYMTCFMIFKHCSDVAVVTTKCWCKLAHVQMKCMIQTKIQKLSWSLGKIIIHSFMLSFMHSLQPHGLTSIQVDLNTFSWNKMNVNETSDSYFIVLEYNSNAEHLCYTLEKHVMQDGPQQGFGFHIFFSLWLTRTTCRHLKVPLCS